MVFIPGPETFAQNMIVPILLVIHIRAPSPKALVSSKLRPILPWDARADGTMGLR